MRDASKHTTGETFPGRGHRVLLVQRQTGTTGSSYNEPKATAPLPAFESGSRPAIRLFVSRNNAKCVQAHLHIRQS